MLPVRRSSPLVLLLGLAACSPDSGTVAPGTGDDDGGGGTSGSQGGGAPGTGGSTAGPSVGTGPGSGGSTSSGDGGGGASAPCAAGTIVCEGATKKVCDGNGGFSEETACDPGVCLTGVGCTTCAPGAGTCDGNVSTVCKGDGSGFTSYVCDPEQGVTCDAATGHCAGACAPQLLGESYVGCEYYPTVTTNSALIPGTFAIAVANTTAQPTEVKVHRGASPVSTTPVAAGSVAIIPLPWIPELKSPGGTQLVADGAYRVRTTQPVTVYQYNPIEYSTPQGSTHTNDASLLLPTNAWTGSYRVASRSSWSSFSGFYAVVAAHDGTTVTLAPSATGASVRAGGGVAADGTGTVVLNEGDVLQVLATTDGQQVQAVDLTGTLVSADKAVQVFGGHDCTNIPAEIVACDHLEESMAPAETLSTDYIVTPPMEPVSGSTPNAQMVRVIATAPGTTLTYDPPQPGAPTVLAAAGDHAEIALTSADFRISASSPILVAQYMRGRGDGLPGDPSMALAVPIEQYRSEYLFHAPTNYEANYVNVTAPVGATVTLDGGAIGGFTPIGASGYAIARVLLSNAGDGNHRITGSQPFGISVYGYGFATSYWYPGGQDLEKVSTN